MKPKVVPTSPMHPDRQQTQRRSRTGWTLFVIFFSVVFSAGSVFGLGVLATRFPTVSWLRYFPARQAGESVIIRQTARSESEAIARITRTTLPAALTLSAPAGDDLFAPSDRIGLALSLTSDGLVAFSSSVNTSDGTVAITTAQLQKSINVLNHQAPGLKFGRIDQATTALALADSDEAFEGMRVWVVKYEALNGGIHLVHASLVSLAADIGPTATAERSSDILSRRYLLDHQFGVEWDGALVTDDEGRLLGLLQPATADGRGVLPTGFLQRRLAALGRSEASLTASLGVTYVDLSKPHALLGLPDRGALVRRVDSAATAEWGLLAGDVITAVNRVPLSAKYGLSDAISDYEAGETVRVDVVRNGQAAELSVTLGTADTI